jgi:hypothetical protein
MEANDHESFCSSFDGSERTREHESFCSRHFFAELFFVSHLCWKTSSACVESTVCSEQSYWGNSTSRPRPTIPPPYHKLKAEHIIHKLVGSTHTPIT